MTYCPNGSWKKKTILITLGLLNTDPELKRGSKGCIYSMWVLLRTEPSGFQSLAYACLIVVVQYRIKDAGFFLDLFKAMVLCLFFHGVIHVLGTWLADKVLKV